MENREPITRRQLLRGAASATGVAAAGAGLVPAAVAQVRGLLRIRAGAAEVIVISDGSMTQPEAIMLPDRSRGEIEVLFQRDGGSFREFHADNKAAIVRIGNETILIDAGAGPDFLPTLGRLHDQLAAAGIEAKAVTKVVFTHAHADHFWGAVDPLGGGALFDKAEHLMDERELDFWRRPDAALRVAEPFRGMALGTARRLKALDDRLRPLKAGTEIVPGLVVVDTAGHSPGHVSLLVGTGSEQVMIGGDALVQSVVSFTEPGWRWGPDMDADKAIVTRRRMLDRLAADRTRLLGYHFPWPGIGRVERKGSGYRFLQE